MIEKDGCFLVAQRNSGRLAGRWEFPGGKVSTPESPQEALEREILEELGVRIQVGELIIEVPFQVEECRFRLLAFSARLQGGCFRLRDHSQIRWVKPEGLRNLDLTEPDIPVAARIERCADECGSTGKKLES